MDSPWFPYNSPKHFEKSSQAIQTGQQLIKFMTNMNFYDFKFNLNHDFFVLWDSQSTIVYEIYELLVCCSTEQTLEKPILPSQKFEETAEDIYKYQ